MMIYVPCLFMMSMFCNGILLSESNPSAEPGLKLDGATGLISGQAVGCLRSTSRCSSVGFGLLLCVGWEQTKR